MNLQKTMMQSVDEHCVSNKITLDFLLNVLKTTRSYATEHEKNLLNNLYEFILLLPVLTSKNIIDMSLEFRNATNETIGLLMKYQKRFDCIHLQFFIDLIKMKVMAVDGIKKIS